MNTANPPTTPPASQSPSLLSRWPIRNQLLFGVGLLLLLVLLLSASTFYGRYAYRGLVKSLGRLSELRQVNDLVRQVNDLRLTACRLSRCHEQSSRFRFGPHDDLFEMRDAFRDRISDVQDAVQQYREQLLANAETNLRIGGGQRELEIVSRMQAALEQMHRADREAGLFEARVDLLRSESARLQMLTGLLPSQLRHNISDFTEEVRGTYRTFLFFAYFSLALTAVVLVLLVRLVYRNVFRPLRILAEGSRRIAAGSFHHRVALEGDGELAELACTMNGMTDRFLAVRDRLDQQVQERTRLIVQSERLASAGFLAAGVSHEINNPLASIAMSAESLERRLSREPLAEVEADMRSYLRMISSEASRCQGITAKLLDFSRMGDAQREPTRLARLIREVVQVLRLGKYRGAKVELHTDESLVAHVNPAEIKQVVLNLVSNALDAIDEEGRVEIHLGQHLGQAEITVRDDGCGMSEEVLEQLFEPFFTQRRDAKGTGLGLSLVDRIVSDHGGRIDAASDGPGRGSVFRVRLPMEAELPERKAA